MRLKVIGVVIVTFITTQDRGLIDHIIALETELCSGGGAAVHFRTSSWNNGWRLEITRVLLGPTIKGCY